MTDLRDQSEQGRIPFRLRIGVTGHRQLDDEEALAGQVRRAIERIRELAPSSPYTQVLFAVMSPLAEGADRLIAREVLRDERAVLEVPLPLPREEYLRDFESESSKREFDELLARAKDVRLLPPSGSREEAYERADRYVVDRCDVLIALWDGEPPRGRGGTAEMVAYAREHRVPLIWISTKGQHEISEEPGSDQTRESLRRLDEYNRSKIAQECSERQVDRQGSELLAAAQRSGAEALPMQALSAWVTPFYVRADLLAMRYQPWYHALTNALFLLAAAAVAAVASQALFAPDKPELVWVEVGLMLGLLFIVGVGRRWRFNDRWISYRFLADRFRSAFFLALAGLSGRREGGLERVYLGHPSEEWLRRAFSEVWGRRPQVEVSESAVEGLRRFLAEAWIQDQINYHRRMSRKHGMRHLRLSRTTEFLFGATVLAAVLHALGLGGGGSAEPVSWANLLILLAIAMPALGAAVSGIRDQRDYLRHSERFGRMAHYLQSTKMRMEAAPDIETVREIAAEAEGLMLEENRDWFVVLKFHDFELHV
jgi:hypothetical protein